MVVTFSRGLGEGRNGKIWAGGMFLFCRRGDQVETRSPIAQGPKDPWGWSPMARVRTGMGGRGGLSSPL